MLTDAGAKYVLGVENAALHVSVDRQSQNASATITTTRAAFNDVVLGVVKMEEQVKAGRAKVDGAGEVLAEFLSLLDTFDFWFPIATPRST
jgi:alkyl sulfatase BDS1-like metallo-beta-lactamase superfamily hydrolase